MGRDKRSMKIDFRIKNANIDKNGIYNREISTTFILKCFWMKVRHETAVAKPSIASNDP